MFHFFVHLPSCSAFGAASCADVATVFRMSVFSSRRIEIATAGVARKASKVCSGRGLGKRRKRRR